MLKFKNYTFLLILFISLLSGCMSAPPIDTLNKRMAVFEISYNEALKGIDLWITEGRLKGVDLVKAKNYVKDMKAARSAMYLAKNAGDLQQTQNQLTAANIALSELRRYINAKEVIQ